MKKHDNIICLVKGVELCAEWNQGPDVCDTHDTEYPHCSCGYIYQVGEIFTDVRGECLDLIRDDSEEYCIGHLDAK